jgi:phage terminase small subunit
MARDLTPKQQRFVQEYLLDLNATQAEARHGQAARLLTRVSIKATMVETASGR